MRPVLLVLAMLALGAAPAAAQPGMMVEGVLGLGPKRVPLPPGPWRVLYQATEPGRTAEGNMGTRTHRAVLVQERANQAAALVIAHAAQEVGAAWNPFGICVNANAIARQIQSAVRAALDCRGLVLVGSGRGANTPAYLNALYDEGERRPGWIPPRWVSAQFVVSEQMHMVSVEYRFAPNVFSPAAAGGANWHEGARNAAQTAFVERLNAWGVAVQAGLKRGLYGREPEPLPAAF